MDEVLVTTSEIQKLEDPDTSPIAESVSAVDRWHSKGEAAENLQYIGKLSILDETDALLFSRRVAALTNGAFYGSYGVAWLIVESKDCVVRQNLSDSYEKPLELTLADEDSKARFLDTLNALLIKYLVFPPTLVPSEQQISMDYHVFRIVPNISPFPAFDWDTRLSVWRLSIYAPKKDTNGMKPWTIESTGRAVAIEMYCRILHHCATDIDLPVDENEIGQQSVSLIEKLLRRYAPDSIHSFMQFWVQSLIRTDPGERAVSARILSELNPLWRQEQKRYLAQLLVGLFADQRTVRLDAITALGRIGDGQIYYLVRQLYPFFQYDSVVQEKLISTLGDLAPTHAEVSELIEISRSESHKNDKVFGEAITKIFRRLKIPRYDTELRMHFREQIYRFNYPSALELIKEHGSEICLSKSVRALIVGVLESVVLRNDMKEPQFADALNRLKECTIAWPRNLDVRINDSLMEMVAELENLVGTLSPEEQKIAFAILSAERTIYDDQSHDLSARIYSATDVLLRQAVMIGGIPFETGRPNKIDRQWLSNNKSIITAIENPGRNFETGLGIELLEALLAHHLLPARFDADKLLQVKAIVNGFDQLINQRHSSVVGHGTMNLPKSEIEKDIGSVEYLWEQLLKLFEIITDKRCNLRSLRSINGDILQMLTLADTVDLAVYDFS